MNFRKSHSAKFSGRWTRFIKSMAAVAFMMPVVAFSASPAPVNLGTSGNFIILAKTGISTTGTTAITGDLGVSPSAATSITGFDLIADATNTFSTSALVTGKIYSANHATPTPTMMTAAIADMETAYTDAAGRTLPDYTELYTGNVTGKTLLPGLYKWGTSVLVSAGGVTISGSPSDVWIFQIAGDLTVGNAAIVTLAGGAMAKNIFWQVAGQVTIGTTAQMKGIILCQTLIDMQNGSTLSGRALAQTAVTTNANTVAIPAVTSVSYGVVTEKDIFGISRGKELGINAGAYEIAAYDLSGRMVFFQKATAKAGFVKMVVPRNICNVNIVRLTQGDRSIVRKIQNVR